MEFEVPNKRLYRAAALLDTDDLKIILDDALSLFVWAAEQRRAGYALYIAKPDGTDLKVVSSNLLNNVPLGQ